jgi:tetraprenyl-beta-curcumene synthase
VPTAESAFEAPMSDRGGSRTHRGLRGYALFDGALTFVVFVRLAVRYWLFVFPRVGSELRRWRRSASRIRDPRLRRLALAALDKRSNMEGAAAFAVFAGAGNRRDVVRALVAFQAIYNHVDMLAEQPGRDPVRRAQRLHGALLSALEPGSQSARGAQRLGSEDQDYLAELIEASRWALSRLPGYPAVAPFVRSAATRIVAFQSLSLGEGDELELWALQNALSMDGLAWWETAAASGSSLSVLALVAASASATLCRQELLAIDLAYSSVIGSLHSLLDSTLDEVEDAATGQLSLVGCYRSSQVAAASMGALAMRAMDAARGLPDGRAHAVMTAAMTCSYLVDCRYASVRAKACMRAVRTSIGARSRPMLLIFRLRRLTSRVAARTAAEVSLAPPTAALVDPGKRGAGARAA